MRSRPPPRPPSRRPTPADPAEPAARSRGAELKRLQPQPSMSSAARASSRGPSPRRWPHRADRAPGRRRPIRDRLTRSSAPRSPRRPRDHRDRTHLPRRPRRHRCGRRAARTDRPGRRQPSRCLRPLLRPADGDRGHVGRNRRRNQPSSRPASRRSSSARAYRHPLRRNDPLRDGRAPQQGVLSRGIVVDVVPGHRARLRRCPRGGRTRRPARGPARTERPHLRRPDRRRSAQHPRPQRAASCMGGTAVVSDRGPATHAASTRRRPSRSHELDDHRLDPLEHRSGRPTPTARPSTCTTRRSNSTRPGC